MNDDYYYHKSRAQQLEAELEQAKKTIAKLNEKLYNIQVAVRNRSSVPPSADQAAAVYEILNHIAYIAYGWDKK